jgi:hypothetical protein
MAVLSMIASVVRAYSAVPLDTKTDIYYLSMDACLQSISAATTDTRLARTPVIVLRDGITTDFPDDHGHIEYLDSQGIRQRYAQTRKEFPAMAIAPMRNQGDKLVVRCYDYRVSIQKRKTILGVMGGWDVLWRHDCGNNKYVIEKVNRWFVRVD